MVPGGAARLYLNDDQWRETVSQLMESAQLVIIQVGTTVGIRWEIASAVERLSPDRILLSLAPLKLNRWKEPSLTPKQRLFSRLPAISPSGYQAFRASMGGIFPAGLPHNVADAQFIRFMSDWEPQLIRVHERSPMVFPFVSVTADLRESFRAPLDESSKAELPHAPRGHRGHGLLALITYVVLPLAVSMQLAGLIGETPAPPSSNDRTIQDGAISRAIRIQPTDLSFSILGREGFRRESIASSVTFYSGDGTTEAASFCVARLDGVAQEDSLASAFTESIEIEGFSPSMITKFTVSIDGRDWTSLEATSHDTRGTRTASLRCHSGDLGTFVMVSAARAQTESTVATWRTISGRMFESFKFQTIPDSAYVGSLKQHR
jgi:hypothetical protein